MNHTIRIPRDTFIRPSLQPVFLEGGEDACLLIHGFSGYPGEMAFLGMKLHDAGYTVSIPRLPGHGTNTADFRESDGTEWLRRCVDSYLELSSSHRHVVICGFSLGGVLAIHLAARFNPSGCVLYAPAIKANNALLPLTPALQYLIRRIPSGVTDTSDDPDRIYLAEEYWKWRYVRQAAEMYKLQKKAKRVLGDIRCNTLVFVSEADRSVPLRAADIVKEGIGENTDVEIIRLRKSGHVLVNESERESVAAGTINWLEGRKNKWQKS